jgi:hypothetical protein
MQRFTMVRYSVKPGQEAENERLARAVFAELKDKPQSHVSYALFGEGRDFVHVFINKTEDDASTVTGLESFKRFAKDLRDRCETPPEENRFHVRLIDSVGLTPV